MRKLRGASAAVLITSMLGGTPACAPDAEVAVDEAVVETKWQPGPALPEPRWLHGAGADAQGHVAVAGGYVMAPPHSYLKQITRQYGVGPWVARILDLESQQWRASEELVDFHQTWEFKFSGEVIRREGVSAMSIPENWEIVSSGGILAHEYPPIVGSRSGLLYWFNRYDWVRLDLTRGMWMEPFPPANKDAIDRVKNGLRKRPKPSWARATAVLVEDQRGHLLLIGGTSIQHTPAANVDVYDIEKDRWDPAAPLSHPRIEHAAAVAPDGKIWVFGGGKGTRASETLSREEARAALSSVEVYDPETDRWSPGPPMPIPRLLLTATTGSDGRIYLVGGVENRVRGDSLGRVDVLDPKTGTWSEGPPLRVPRHGHAAAGGSDGKIYVLGGWKSGGAGPAGALDSVEVLDPSRL